MKQLDTKILFDGQITPHFNIWEFRCRANNEILINAEVIAHIQRLEKLRVWYNRAMVINSGYRTPEHNAKIGGAKASYHMQGIASDVSLPLGEFATFSKARQNEFLNNIKKKWLEICNTDGLGGGVGFYDVFFHLDSRKKYSHWDLRSK
jgi:uncharacterized protein YcbK (DUF882 family)